MAITVETLQVAIEQKGAEKASAGLKKVAVAAGGLAATYKVVSKALGAMMDAWAVQEKSEIRLRSALKATGQEVAGNTVAIQKFTSALQKQTNIGDEVTIGLVATATAMGATSDEAMRATEAAVGLSESLGMGLDASLKAVINAQEGNYQQLQRYIPALKGVTDETEAWAIINDSVEAGLISLSEQTGTFTGQMTALKNAWGDYLEQLGRYLSLDQNSIFSKMTGALERFTQRFALLNDRSERFMALSEESKKAIEESGISVEQWGREADKTAYWLARLAQEAEAVKEVAQGEIWKPEKSREYWQQFTEDVMAANTHMSELERIEYNRNVALANAVTEYKDFNEQLEAQINNYYDIEAARVKANAQLEEEKKRQKEIDALNRYIASAQAERDQMALEAHNRRMAQIQAEKEALYSMYSSMRGIVQQYYANEIAAAGDNEEKLQEIREKQFKANQAFSIADTIINTSTAIMKVLAQGGIFAIPLSVAMGALGAAQIAMIASAKPSYATGTPAGGYVVPPGYEGDNYPVMAKSGETVNVTRQGEGGGGMAQISIVLDSSVIARVTTNLIENRQIVIRQSDVVGL